jgi:hypothetical protein
MAPILGIWASSKSTVAADTGAMFPLQVVTVGSTSVADITFSNIPTTGYSHLQLRSFIFGTSGTAQGSVNVQFNGDTGSNYAFHLLQGDGSTATAYGIGSSSNGRYFGYAGGIRTTFATAGVVDILDYANTNKYKTMRGICGNDFNGSGEVQLSSSLWMNTNAITSIRVWNSSMNLAQYSQFALYAVKGA